MSQSHSQIQTQAQEELAKLVQQHVAKQMAVSQQLVETRAQQVRENRQVEDRSEPNQENKRQKEKGKERDHSPLEDAEMNLDRRFQVFTAALENEHEQASDYEQSSSSDGAVDPDEDASQQEQQQEERKQHENLQEEIFPQLNELTMMNDDQLRNEFRKQFSRDWMRDSNQENIQIDQQALAALRAIEMTQDAVKFMEQSRDGLLQKDMPLSRDLHQLKDDMIEELKNRPINVNDEQLDQRKVQLQEHKEACKRIVNEMLEKTKEAHHDHIEKNFNEKFKELFERQMRGENRVRENYKLEDALKHYEQFELEELNKHKEEQQQAVNNYLDAVKQFKESVDKLSQIRDTDRERSQEKQLQKARSEWVEAEQRVLRERLSDELKMLESKSRIRLDEESLKRADAKTFEKIYEQKKMQEDLKDRYKDLHETQEEVLRTVKQELDKSREQIERGEQVNATALQKEQERLLQAMNKLEKEFQQLDLVQLFLLSNSEQWYQHFLQEQQAAKDMVLLVSQLAQKSEHRDLRNDLLEAMDQVTHYELEKREWRGLETEAKVFLREAGNELENIYKHRAGETLDQENLRSLQAYNDYKQYENAYRLVQEHYSDRTIDKEFFIAEMMRATLLQKLESYEAKYGKQNEFRERFLQWPMHWQAERGDQVMAVRTAEDILAPLIAAVIQTTREAWREKLSEERLKKWHDLLADEPRYRDMFVDAVFCKYDTSQYIVANHFGRQVEHQIRKKSNDIHTEVEALKKILQDMFRSKERNLQSLEHVNRMDIKKAVELRKAGLAIAENIHHGVRNLDAAELSRIQGLENKLAELHGIEHRLMTFLTSGNSLADNVRPKALGLYNDVRGIQGSVMEACRQVQGGHRIELECGWADMGDHHRNVAIQCKLTETQSRDNLRNTIHDAANQLAGNKGEKPPSDAAHIISITISQPSRLVEQSSAELERMLENILIECPYSESVDELVLYTSDLVPELEDWMNAPRVTIHWRRRIR